MITVPCNSDQVFWCYGFEQGLFHADGTGLIAEIVVAAKRDQAVAFFEGYYSYAKARAMMAVSLDEVRHMLQQGDAAVKTGQALKAEKASLLGSLFSSSSWFLVSGLKGDQMTLRVVEAKDPVTAVKAVLCEDPEIQPGSVVSRNEYQRLEGTLEGARLGKVIVVHAPESRDPEEASREMDAYNRATMPNYDQICAEAAADHDLFMATPEGQEWLKNFIAEQEQHKDENKS